MADLVSVSVVCPTHTIVPWSVVTVDLSSPNHTFSDLLQSLKAGVHPSVPTSRELCEAVIDTVAVGRDKQSLSIVGMAMNVMDVCQTFGNFVKFRVIPKNESVTPTGINPVKNTFEIHRPSLKAKKQKSLSYGPSKQHATNVGVVVQCEECNKWRLMFSKRKLSLHSATRTPENCW